MEQIDPYEIQSWNTEYLYDPWLIKIGICEPWCYHKQYCRDQDTRAYLEYQCESEEILRLSIFIFDDIFWQKIIQTLGASEIVECSEECHKTNDTIYHTYSVYWEIIRYDDLDEISEWADQQGEKIEPKSFFDKFLCKSLFWIKQSTADKK